MSTRSIRRLYTDEICGNVVFATARDVEKVTWTKGLDNITHIKLDITKAADITAAVDTVLKATGGKLDFLINNAARNHFKPILDASIDEVKELYDSNYFAPIAVTQAFAPLIIAVRYSETNVNVLVLMSSRRKDKSRSSLRFPATSTHHGWVILHLRSNSQLPSDNRRPVRLIQTRH